MSTLGIILVILLILVLFGGIGTGRVGYGGGVSIGTLLVIILILVLLGVI